MKYLGLVIFILWGLTGWASITVPDFAFPNIVIEQADSALKSDLYQGNDLCAFRNLLDICVAQNILAEPETTEKNISLVDSVSQKLKGEFKNLGFLLEAQLMQQQQNKDYEQILKYIERATQNLNNFNNISLESVKKLLTEPNPNQGFIFTVSDFLAMKSVDILRDLAADNPEEIIPFFPDQIDKENTIAKITDEKKHLFLWLKNQGSDYAKVWAICEESKELDSPEREKYLMSEANKFKGNEAEGLLLYETWRMAAQLDAPSKTILYHRMSEWLAENPSAMATERVKEAIAILGEKKIEIELPNLNLPGEEITGTATISNLNNGYVLIYKLNPNEFDGNDQLVLKKFTGQRKPDCQIEITGKSEIPFSNKEVIRIPGLENGIYVAIPSETLKLKKGWNKTTVNANYLTFRVSDISILILSGVSDDNSIFVVDARNQKPIEGATVKQILEGKKKVIGETGSNGKMQMPAGYYRIEVQKGKSIATTEVGFSSYQAKQGKINHATLLTDLGVYRPGDIVKFAIIGWQEEHYKKHLLQDTIVKVIMRDANFKEIGSAEIKLDNYGRGNGMIEIPKGRLLGKYRLMAEFPFKEGENAGTTEFEVSDYILPGFYVVFEQKENGPNESMVFEGVAKTYTGIPIKNAQVDVSVQYFPWFGWRMSRSSGSYAKSIETNDSGYFKIELPTENLKGTKFEQGRYEIRAEVLNELGERVDSRPLFFFLGNRYEIRPEISNETAIARDSLTLKVPVYSITGKPEPRKVEYTFSGPVEFSGEFVSPSLTLPTSILPSGQYKISFKTVDNSEESTTETIIYRPSESKVPYSTPLWLPDKEIIYLEGDKFVDINFGSYYKGNYLLTVTSTESQEPNVKWIETTGSMQKMRVEIPENGGEIYLSIAGTHNFELKTGRITIKPEKKTLTIRTESFRDKTESGEEETWKFKFETNEGFASSIPVFAVMSDNALNAISDFKWNLRLNGMQPYCTTQLGGMRESNKYGYKIFNPVESKYYGTLVVPEWETYGYPLAGFLTINGPLLMKTMATSRAGGIVETAVASDDMAVAEEAVQEENDSLNDNEEEFRPIEMPLAFFRPDLITDGNGDVSLNFKMPDYNTTWQFQIAGYTENLVSSTKSLDIVATKPVMVKSNIPKYLRTGDKTEISASIYNNGQTDRMISGGFIIYSNTGNNRELLVRKNFKSENIKAGDSRVISVVFDVPFNVSDIRVEVFGEDENCRDGEAGNIEILPSSTPVIESIPFYLTSSEDKYELKLPEYKKNDQLVLRYTDNPLWDAILSLASIGNGGNGSVLSVARKLYVNLMTQKLINSDPNILNGLAKLLDNNLFAGSLNEKSQIKLAENEQTPWVNDAEGENERIQSLKLFLDSEQTGNIIEKFKTSLLNSQLEDGGWSWFEGMKSSVYITEEIINVLGLLDKDDLLSNDLKEAAKKGINYIDKNLAEHRKKGNSVNVIELLEYFNSRRNFDFRKSEAIMGIEKDCLDSVSKNWRKWGIVEKCQAAQFLWNNPTWKEEAKTIVASIEDFVIKDIRLGWNFGLQNRNFRQYSELNAEGKALQIIETIEPDSAYIEGLRKWLLLQKETQDWSANPNNINVINVLVSSSSGNPFDANEPEILIEKQKLELPAEGKITGNFSMTLNPTLLSSETLEIYREIGQPAWGGLISRYIQPIKNVKSQKTDLLSIKKEITKRINNKLKKSDKIKKGDKVTVVLSIEVKKDMDFVAITDERGACLRPTEWLSGMVSENGVWSYKETQDSKTSFFIDHLKSGNYTLTYDCVADREGDYTIGIASIQSLYAPEQVAHSEGLVLKVKN